ncbi:succinylglutamate desuccinylase/aspartoacylase domain-containing protein [Nitratireductor arenosus]|nr:succinylglutamate desuccinylase/aspartoacylase family protein [Nitratireductor arenosus]
MKRFFDDAFHRPRALLLIAAAAATAIASGAMFLSMHEAEPIVAGPGVTSQKMLSDYVPAMAGTPADTPVFILEGAEPGGTALVLGGTHPQEISGLMGAVLMVENATPQRGRIIVLPQANRSGFTHTDPLEGFPHTYKIETAGGTRWFRVGMRLTNPVHQWPDPDLHLHPQSGERMVGWESRNLNRNFPGDPDGRYTTRLNAAIVALARAEGVDIVLDMHEAYPEYPIINMLVAHERAFEIATLTMIGLQTRGIAMDLMASPPALRGLSHREFGDHTEAFAILSETANPAMGRFRGRTDEALVVEGKDVNYVRAAALDRLFVPFDENGHPLRERTARQLATIEEMLIAYNEANPDKQVEVSGIPAYQAVIDEGIGRFLLPVPAQ